MAALYWSIGLSVVNVRWPMSRLNLVFHDNALTDGCDVSVSREWPVGRIGHRGRIGARTGRRRQSKMR